MIGVDTNILVDLAVASSAFHALSVEGVKKLDDPICTTPTNVGECLRLLTHPRVFQKPLSITKAVHLLEDMFEHYRISILEEGPYWWKQLIEIEKEVTGIRGNEVFDARIAICLAQNGVKRFCTRDSDFRKYPFLRLVHWSKK